MRWTSSIAGATGSVPTISAATCILLESALGFGIRVQPPAASWGNMLYQAQSAMSTEPWLARFPGLFIFVTVAAINTLGDSLAERRM
jgi:peptide/nickel transport system permease protein